MGPAGRLPPVRVQPERGPHAQHDAYRGTDDGKDDLSHSAPSILKLTRLPRKCGWRRRKWRGPLDSVQRRAKLGSEVNGPRCSIVRLLARSAAGSARNCVGCLPRAGFTASSQIGSSPPITGLLDRLIDHSRLIEPQLEVGAGRVERSPGEGFCAVRAEPRLALQELRRHKAAPVELGHDRRQPAAHVIELLVASRHAAPGPPARR